ncbi:unnamed protein product [Pylaiella littoralis]
MKFIFALSFVLVAAATAFVPTASVGRVGSTASRTRSNVVLLRAKEDGEKHVGTGGMADTRDPEPRDDPDPRKSISAAPSFEEYLKQKQAERGETP